MEGTAKTFVDRRAQPRRTVATPARAFPGEARCLIIDINDDGARLSCDTPWDLGDFPVIVEWESGRAHDAVVVWRSESQAGVRFIRSCLLTERSPAAFATAKKAWEAEQATLTPSL